jgi:catalase
VMISAPVFFARTPEQFVEFLKVRVPQPDGKGPDQEKVKAFSAAHPETTRQGAWLTSHQVPASYASVNYWAVHAYQGANGAGKTATVKFKAVPQAGEQGLTDEEAGAKSNDFYEPELKDRLAKGPAKFNLLAILGEASDPVDDPTASWPEEQRKTVTLGVLEVAAIAPAQTCDGVTFDPANLTDGIAPSKGDPIFPLRSPAYAISLTRRAN